MELRTPRWWQTGVVYEIDPRSFADADGAGTRNLAGITGRLDDFGRFHAARGTAVVAAGP